jgi:hypothetical protein
MIRVMRDERDHEKETVPDDVLYCRIQLRLTWNIWRSSNTVRLATDTIEIIPTGR